MIPPHLQKTRSTSNIGEKRNAQLIAKVQTIVEFPHSQMPLLCLKACCSFRKCFTNHHRGPHLALLQCSFPLCFGLSLTHAHAMVGHHCLHDRGRKVSVQGRPRATDSNKGGPSLSLFLKKVTLPKLPQMTVTHGHGHSQPVTSCRQIGFF